MNDTRAREHIGDLLGADEPVCTSGTTAGEMRCYALSRRDPRWVNYLPAYARERITGFLPQHLRDCKGCDETYRLMDTAIGIGTVDAVGG